MTINLTKLRLIRSLLVLIGLALVLAAIFWTRGPSLLSIKNAILQEYSNVEQLNAERLSSIPSNDLLVFDVRERAEFEVSHLSNALHLEPSITPSEFEQRYGTLLANKTVVFYCSVGRRSSQLASDLEDVLQDNQANEFYNLSGGIFQWRNENRPLINMAQKTTKKVHPYNAFWGKLVKDKSAIEY